MHGMVAPTVALSLDAVENQRVFLHILSHTEKGRLMAGFTEHIENARRPFRMGAIIKSEVNLVPTLPPCPLEFWKQCGNGRRNAGRIHGCNFNHKWHR